jgi:distribution and morphology protein 31
MKTISLWSLQRTAGAVMNVLKTMTDPMSAHLKDVYSNGQIQFELLESMPLVPEL